MKVVVELFLFRLEQKLPAVGLGVAVRVMGKHTQPLPPHYCTRHTLSGDFVLRVWLCAAVFLNATMHMYMY